MSKYANTAVTLVVTFLVTLCLNSVAAYFTTERGTVTISHPLAISGKQIVTLAIENNSNNFIDGVVIRVPQSVTTTDIYSDSTATIDFKKPIAGQQSATVKIGQIVPKHITTLAFTLADGAFAGDIQLLNARESGLTFRRENELDSPIRREMVFAIITSLIAAVATAFIQFTTGASIAELHDKIEKNAKEIERESAKLRKSHAHFAKLRILLLARIADYSKELEFWRNCIKEFAGKNFEKSGRPDELFDHVTKSLKTFGTRWGTPEYEAIRVAAAWLREDQKDIEVQETTQSD